MAVHSVNVNDFKTALLSPKIIPRVVVIFGAVKVVSFVKVCSEFLAIFPLVTVSDIMLLPDR